MALDKLADTALAPFKDDPSSLFKFLSLFGVLGTIAIVAIGEAELLRYAVGVALLGVSGLVIQTSRVSARRRKQLDAEERILLRLQRKFRSYSADDQDFLRQVESTGSVEIANRDIDRCSLVRRLVNDGMLQCRRSDSWFVIIGGGQSVSLTPASRAMFEHLGASAQYMRALPPLAGGTTIAG